MPSGREHVRLKASGPDSLVIRASPAGRAFGLRSAAPDPSGRGGLKAQFLSDGTSAAAAMATRTAHRIFDVLSDRNEDGPLADADPAYFGVILKALLVHGARWPAGTAEIMEEIFGPVDGRRHQERRENVARFLGFGVPQFEIATECAVNRATLIGYGALATSEAHQYRVPLPQCLSNVTDPRSLVVTLAWFAPSNPRDMRYRGAKLEASPISKDVGVERIKAQPGDATVKRGTVFHERYEGTKAVPFVDKGELNLQVWCKEEAGCPEGEQIRYGLAVTLAAETMIPVYDEIRLQVQTRVRP